MLAEMQRDALRARLLEARSGATRAESTAPRSSEAATHRAGPRLAPPRPRTEPEIQLERLLVLAGGGKGALSEVARILLQEGRGEGETAVALRGAFESLARSGELRDVALELLLSAGTYPEDLRQLAAASCGAVQATREEADRTVAVARTEKDPALLETLVGIVVASREASVASLLAAAELAVASPDALANAGFQAISVLEGRNDPEALAALRALAANTDSPIAEEARLAVYRRDPPIPGYLVESLEGSGTARSAGLQACDVIVSADGTAVSDTRDLDESKGHALAVWREGALLSVRLDAGRVGVSGEVIPRPQEAQR
jgi:hypothetical protein